MGIIAHCFVKQKENFSKNAKKNAGASGAPAKGKRSGRKCRTACFSKQLIFQGQGFFPAQALGPGNIEAHDIPFVHRCGFQGAESS